MNFWETWTFANLLGRISAEWNLYEEGVPSPCVSFQQLEELKLIARILKMPEAVETIQRLSWKSLTKS